MSTRSRRDSKGRIGRGKYKLIDDRSGFEILSTNAWIDHRGRITDKSNWDPIHYTEMVINYPPENSPLPFLRPEPEGTFIDPGTIPTYPAGNTYSLPAATFGPDNAEVWNITRQFWHSDNLTWDEDPSPEHTDTFGDNYDYWTDIQE